MQYIVLLSEIAIVDLVESLTDIIVRFFGERILSVYVGGSLARGQMTAHSDLDMTVVFRDSVTDAEYEEFARLRLTLQRLSPLRLDFGVESEVKLKTRPTSQSMRQSICMYGDPFLRDVPAQTIDAFAMRSIHKAIHYMTVLRGRPACNPTPLLYPDADARYFGYTHSGDFAAENTFKEGTRIILDMVTRCTTAIVAITLNIECETKKQSVDYYRKQVTGLWGNFVDEIYHFIRDTLHYGLPHDEDQQTKLTRLCERLCDFENHMLSQFKPMILSCLQSDDRRQRKLALVALKNIQFKNDMVCEAVAALPNEFGDLTVTVQSRYAIHDT